MKYQAGMSRQGLQIGQYLFRPRLLPTLATMVIFPVLVALGLWQLQRAEEKQQMLEHFASQQSRPPVDLQRYTHIHQLQPYQKVRVQGQFLADQQLLLDNRTYHGRAGYQVITPMRLNDRRIVLINRGWIPQTAQRSELPRIATPGGEISLTGQVKLDTGGGFSLGESGIKGTAWPRRIQRLEMNELQELLGQNLLPLLVLEDPSGPAGYVRDWYIRKITPEKSTSYAMQWFALALALMIIYFAVNTKRNEGED